MCHVKEKKLQGSCVASSCALCERSAVPAMPRRNRLGEYLYCCRRNFFAAIFSLGIFGRCVTAFVVVSSTSNRGVLRLGDHVLRGGDDLASHGWTSSPAAVKTRRKITITSSAGIISRMPNQRDSLWLISTSLHSSSAAGTEEGKGSQQASSSSSSSNAAHVEDPFRPERASLAPTIINALQRVLFHGENARAAATLCLEQRAASNDWKLTDEERQIVTARVCGVSDNLTELNFMLASAVSRNPFITKYGMLADYGMGDDVDDNPLTQMNQAECLLALYMLHKETGEGSDGESAVERKGSVDFLDADRLEVLQGGG